MLEGCVLVLSLKEERPVASCDEKKYKYSGFIKGAELLQELSDC
jgi:hypothetical protein